MKGHNPEGHGPYECDMGWCQTTKDSTNGEYEPPNVLVTRWGRWT